MLSRRDASAMPGWKKKPSSSGPRCTMARAIFRTVSSGTASVNGVEQTGTIRNNIGDVVTMPRNAVEDDPKVACHVGLHVGSFSYANGFGRHLLTVKVDPADVVSVPEDHGNQKMRVCAYTVVEVNEGRAEFGQHAIR